MPNRYVRDKLIKIALDQAQLPNLTVHDIPDGVAKSDAYSLQWLQDILDFWYHLVPFSSTVGNVPLNCTAHSNSITLPTDFILDVRNGYLTQIVPSDNTSFQRRYRVPFQKFLTRSLYYQKQITTLYPVFYSIVGNVTNSAGTATQQTMMVTPTPSIATVGVLWYYKLPPILQANNIPDFPSDYVCIEYIRIRALEWANVVQPGTAKQFCDKIITSMKAAGLMNEPEDDEVPLDELVFRNKGNTGMYNSYNSWMGAV